MVPWNKTTEKKQGKTKNELEKFGQLIPISKCILRMRNSARYEQHIYVCTEGIAHKTLSISFRKVKPERLMLKMVECHLFLMKSFFGYTESKKIGWKNNPQKFDPTNPIAEI